MQSFDHKKTNKTPKQLVNMREKGGTAVEIEGFKGGIDKATLDMVKGIVDDVGKQKSSGVVFVVGGGEDPDEDGNVPPNGIFFTHDMSIMGAIMLLINSSGVDRKRVITRLLED